MTVLQVVRVAWPEDHRVTSSDRITRIEKIINVMNGRSELLEELDKMGSDQKVCVEVAILKSKWHSTLVNVALSLFLSFFFILLDFFSSCRALFILLKKS